MNGATTSDRRKFPAKRTTFEKDQKREQTNWREKPIRRRHTFMATAAMRRWMVKSYWNSTTATSCPSGLSMVQPRKRLPQQCVLIALTCLPNRQRSWNTQMPFHILPLLCSVVPSRSLQAIVVLSFIQVLLSFLVQPLDPLDPFLCPYWSALKLTLTLCRLTIPGERNKGSWPAMNSREGQYQHIEKDSKLSREEVSVFQCGSKCIVVDNVLTPLGPLSCAIMRIIQRTLRAPIQHRRNFCLLKA